MSGSVVAFEWAWAGQAPRRAISLPVYRPAPSLVPALMIGLRAIMGVGLGLVLGVSSGHPGFWAVTGAVVGSVFGALMAQD